MERHLVLLSSATDTVAQVKGALEPLKYKITVKSGLSSGLKAMQGDELVLLDLPDSISDDALQLAEGEVHQIRGGDITPPPVLRDAHRWPHVQETAYS